MGSGFLFLGVQPRLHSKGRAVFSALQFWIPFYLFVHPLSQNYQIWRGNTWESGVYLKVSHASHPKTAGSIRAPDFLGGDSVFLPENSTVQTYSCWLKVQVNAEATGERLL